MTVQFVDCINLTLDVVPLRHTSIFHSGREKPTQSYLASFILVIQSCKDTWSLHLPLLDRQEVTIIIHKLPHILVRLDLQWTALSTRVPPVLIIQDIFKCQATGIKGSKVCHGWCLLTWHSMWWFYKECMCSIDSCQEDSSTLPAQSFS